MITTLLCLALGASDGWVDVKANGFGFQMPSKPELKNGPINWPTTGEIMLAEWTSKRATGELDVASCYESTVPSLRMISVLHDKFCKEESPGQRRFDRTDATTQARECLLLTQGPDGKRKTLVKILEVGANVCVMSASAKTDKASDEPTAQMRRFVDSLKLTGKPTVVSLTPWVPIKGDGFAFELPEKVESKSEEGPDPKLGKVKTTKWTYKFPQEELNVTCMTGPDVSTPKGAAAILGLCDIPGTKVVRTRLPGGATECTASGQRTMLLRIFQLGTQTCTVGATREKGDPSQDARRFVESFAKAK